MPFVEGVALRGRRQAPLARGHLHTAMSCPPPP
jgi:hypothetical protein